jgi:transcriptional regulator with XRE-family HTH domain
MGVKTMEPIFSDRLRKARENKNLRQAELAKKAGLEASAVSHFEAGRRQPSFHNLRRLADALSVTTDYLLGRDLNLGASGPAVEGLFRRVAELTDEDREVLDGMAQTLLVRRRRLEQEKPDGGRSDHGQSGS